MTFQLVSAAGFHEHSSPC